MCSIIGWLTTGIIGFGWLLVSGRRRVPSPPARITAFIAIRFSQGDLRNLVRRATTRGATFAQRGACSRDVLQCRVVAEAHARDREPPRAEVPPHLPRPVGVVGQQEERQREHECERAGLPR